MLGEIHEVTERTLMVEGLMPRHIMLEPDVANTVIHKAGDTVYCVDTGATLLFRRKLKEAIERLRPFKRFVLFNSHAHPDHVPNNIIVNEVEAEVREHYISEEGLRRFDFPAMFSSYFAEVGECYSIFDGPRFPYSLMFKPLKFISRLGWDPLGLVVKNTLKKFGPYEVSRETMRAFEEKPAAEICIGETRWTGWSFDGGVYALEARGHTRDEIIFYFQEDKVLMPADESVKTFNCWPESDGRRIKEVLGAARQMVEQGEVEILIDSHTHTWFKAEAALVFLRGLLEDYETFTLAIKSSLSARPEGATVVEVYRDLTALKGKSPVIAGFLANEFPKMPGFLKTTIASLLLEKRCAASGPAGKKRFRITEDWD